MLENQVGHAMLISVTLEKFPEVLALAEQYPNFFATVGVHPDYENEPPFNVETLVSLAKHPKVVGVGETGLDYFRLTGDLEWQRERFRIHIKAAIQADLPLIIHTRSAAEDTLRLMREENAAKVGGVMHCFTETYDVAMQAIEMGFYISFSGIVTFKNAEALKEVARQVPLDKFWLKQTLLIWHLFRFVEKPTNPPMLSTWLRRLQSCAAFHCRNSLKQVQITSLAYLKRRKSMLKHFKFRRGFKFKLLASYVV